MQSEGGLPKEDPCRRPPPSTASPCPAWFSRLHRPFFGRSKTPVQERFTPLPLLALVQIAQQRSPDVQPDALLLPIPQPPPARRGMRVLPRQILPAGPAPQNPQNAFQRPAVGGTRSGARGRPLRRCRGGLGSRGRIFSHCASVSNGPDRAIGPPPGAAAPFYCVRERPTMATSTPCTQFCNRFEIISVCYIFFSLQNLYSYYFIPGNVVGSYRALCATVSRGSRIYNVKVALSASESRFLLAASCNALHKKTRTEVDFGHFAVCMSNERSTDPDIEMATTCSSPGAGSGKKDEGILHAKL